MKEELDYIKINMSKENLKLLKDSIIDIKNCTHANVIDIDIAEEIKTIIINNVEENKYKNNNVTSLCKKKKPQY